MIILILLISFLINPLLLNINIFNISFTIFSSLLSIILVYPYLKIKMLIIYSVSLGILFDIIYGIIYINFLLYPVIAILIYLTFKRIKFNLLNLIITSMFIIFIYNTLFYLISNLFDIKTISYIYFLSNLIPLYLINIMYLVIFYILINIVSYKKYIK